MNKLSENIIPVSFKKTQYEQQLLKDIYSASEFIGKSTWIKIACMEKLERDKKNTQYFNTNIQNTHGNIDNIQQNTMANNIPNSLLDINLGL